MSTSDSGEAPPKPSPSPAIKTLVFFDLETTGLPNYQFNRTKITELTMIACDVQHFLAAARKSSGKAPPRLPRVQHKLSVCVDPFKMIDPESTNITGLDNFMLEQQQRFSANTGRLLEHFLQQLRQPVCLVAHNGLGFDYPLLSRELLRVDVKLPDNVWCVDSLALFRKIDKIEAEEQSESSARVDEPIDAEVATPEKTAVADDLLAVIDANKQIDWRKLNETTPKQTAALNASLNHNKTPTMASAAEPTFGGVKSKRKLFTAEVSGPSTGKIFRLEAIYERMFDTIPGQSHYAEADTTNLMTCVCSAGERFVRLIETEAILFSDIVPLGT